MKRILQLLLCIICLLGCTKQSEEEQQFTIYNQIKKQLITKTHFDKDFPFDVVLVYNQMNDGFRYDILIKNVKEDMYTITAMAYANENQEQMCPTIGLFDEDEYHLKKGYINKSKGYYKGIQLSGKCKLKQSVKLYISYYTDEMKTNKIEKYIEVNENEIG